jgi:hypothetical protein
MSTSKPPGSLKAEITSLSKVVDTWLDANKSALVIEMAQGQRLEVPLTPDEFEQRKQNGMRVYDGSKDGPETD